MIIVTTTQGFALVFRSIGEIEGVADQLAAMVSHMKATGSPAPYIYSCAAEATSAAMSFVDGAIKEHAFPIVETVRRQEQ